jgi:HEPN domain-containing protein
MRPPDDVARRLSRDWLAKAEIDVQVSERLLRDGAEFAEAVAFHAQQAAEKSLKALLVARQVEFPKTHDLERLLELVARGDAPLASKLENAADLTPYGVEYRYPGDYEPVSATTASTCLSIARKVFDEVARRLQT